MIGEKYTYLEFGKREEKKEVLNMEGMVGGVCT